ncbi:MAG: hypothetical protein ACI9WU_005425 [Myxococcota bacterium]
MYGIEPYVVGHRRPCVSTSNATKTERLKARVPANVTALLNPAAALQGRSLTDFVVGTATEEARRIIRENQVLELNERDQVAFAEALVNPPAPSPALRAAARRYRGDHV